MGEYEIPLVMFTVFSQWAVGITIAIALLEWIKPDYMKEAGKWVMGKTVYIALGFSVLAAIVSMLHLNNPFKSYTSLLGVGHSWLSREIVAVIVFNLFLMGFAYVWWKKRDHVSLRKALGTLTALTGAVLVVTSATVYYAIPIHPAWHNWTTFANFLLTGLLLGALTVTCFALRAKEEDADKTVVKMLGIYLSILLFSLLITLGSAAVISTGAVESEIAATLTFTSVLFWLRVLGSLVVPASLIVYMIAGKKLAHVNYVFIVTGFVLIGEFSGRMMFYYSVMSQYPWF